MADVDILLGLAFKPTIPVGFEFNDNLKAEVFVSMNLPRLDVKLSTDAPANCGDSANATAPVPNSTAVADTGADIGDAVALGPLMLIEANISITVDVGISVNLPLLPPPFDEVAIEANIFSVGFPLVTACMDPSDAFPSMTATVTAMPTPCNITASTLAYKYANVTQTAIVQGAKLWSNYTVTSTKVERIAMIPTATPFRAQTLAQNSTSSNVTATPAVAAGNTTVALSTGAATYYQPGPSAVMPSGFLAPGNATVVVALAQQAGATLTGAAAPGMDMPKMQWTSLGWQMVIIGFGMAFGVAVL